MGVFEFFRREQRGSIENPNVPISASDFVRVMGWGDLISAAGVTVNVNTALGVPAVWAAVNFLAGTIAGLPLKVYRRDADGQSEVLPSAANQLPLILGEAINPAMSSFEWRKYTFDQVFTGGRGITYIERNNSGQVVNLYALDPTLLTVRMFEGRKFYDVRIGSQLTKTYAATDIIDIPFMLEHDFVDHRGPIASNRDAIGMAIAASRYGSKAFQAGGVPPAVMTGPFQSGAAAARASEDVASTMAKKARASLPAAKVPG